LQIQRLITAMVSMAKDFILSIRMLNELAPAGTAFLFKNKAGRL